ncbi:MAG: hypothetical protein CMP76_13980 [Flavobacterium sp.]|uniref:hypothetical protein n=1 Tax=Flavobacterium sp. TaxID=239 RepID=UPI000C4FAF3C|nr:hypothetical protein [Flavobacterium sp.]MBF04391.1 hypothetical protein [Flavobacterium sp.]|tara:strand:- start:804 stop:1181 length:378 start_codon:yes stop_codon:yes gene_type:complete
MKDKIRIISIVSYLLIILVGQMIGLPFIFWLIFTVFDFGNTDQLFAMFGVIGVIGVGINLSKWKNKKLLTIVSFALMLSPIISRLTQVPIEMFDYLAFEIPLTIFIIAYLIFIVLNMLEKKTECK